MSNCRTYAIKAEAPFVSDGGATISGFIQTESTSENILSTVSGWQPGGGSHPTSMFVKRVVVNGRSGIWFRVNFVRDSANGTTWITFFQGGRPVWPDAAQATQVSFESAPAH